jgi:hypothetical protein
MKTLCILSGTPAAGVDLAPANANAFAGNPRVPD